MGISFIGPLSAGNAVQLILAPENEAIWWRVLRRPDANFVGPVDSGATVVVDQWTSAGVLDSQGLVNGTTYYYQLYSTTDGADFDADGPPVSIVPAATYQDASEDPQTVLINRLILGLAVEVARQTIIPSAQAQPPGIIPVFRAPFALQDKLSFPCVNVHLDDTASGERFLGEMMDPEAGGIGEDAVNTEGWMASFNLNVVGVTLNPDERAALRQAIRRIIQANLAVFDAAGMFNISFSQSDSEQFSENSAPLYLTAGRFACTAPVSITDTAAPVTDVTVSLTVDENTLPQEQVMLPPIYLCIPDSTTPPSAMQLAQYQQGFDSDLIDGVILPNPLAQDGSQFAQYAGMTVKDFAMNCSSLGLTGFATFTLPNTVRGTITYPKIWDPSFMPVWTAAMAAKFAMLETMQLTDSFTSLGLSPVQPYINGEMGYPVENGSNNNTGRNDSALAAAGWTPSGYQAAVVACVTWLNAQPIMAGKTLVVAYFTPGNVPRVNDSGQVIASVDSNAFYNALTASIRAAYTVGRVVFDDTTFATTLTGFYQQLDLPNEGLVVQIQAANETQALVAGAVAAVAAMRPTVFRLEVHPPSVANGWLQDAVSAVTGTGPGAPFK